MGHFNYYSLIPLGALFINGIVWIYIHSQKPRTEVKKAYLILTGTIELWLIWLFTLWLHVGFIKGTIYFFPLQELLTKDATTIYFVIYNKLLAILWISVGFLFLKFVYAYINKRKDLIYKIFMWIVIITYTLNVSTNLINKAVKMEEWGPRDVSGPLYIVFTIIPVVLPILYGLYLLLKEYYKTDSKIKKHSLLLLFFGSFLPLLGGFVTDVIVNYVPLAAVFTVVQSIFIFIAVLKYDFFTIDIKQAASNIISGFKAGFIIFDNQYNIIHINETSKNILNLNPKNLKDVAQVLKDYSPEKLYNAEEFYIKDTDKYLRISQYSIEYRNELIGKILFILNITELKKAELKIQKAREKLLLQEKMASLGALTAGIAHEIENPLNFINNFADISNELFKDLKKDIDISKDCFDKNMREEITFILEDLKLNITKISEHGKRIDSIVKSMLLHAKGEKSVRQKVDINKLLEKYIDLAYHSIRAKNHSFNIKIIKEFDKNMKKVSVFEQDIGRVFLNILDNACYAADLKKKQTKDANFKPELKVSTSKKHIHSDKKITEALSITSREKQEIIEIRIRDNGPGIREELKDKIFLPFFTTKPPGIGTGLGLSISYDIIVNKHKGEILIDSKEGEYTEFIIRLPVIEEELNKEQ